MPGQIDVDPPPSFPLLEDRLEGVDHMAVIKVAPVKDQERTAGPDFPGANCAVRQCFRTCPEEIIARQLHIACRLDPRAVVRSSQYR